MILITGASSGIGQACAELLAAKGHDLFLVARRKDRLEAIAQKLSQQYKIKVMTSQLDISHAGEVDDWVHLHHSEIKQVSALINNAGLAKSTAPIQEGSLADWEQVFQTNVMGLLRLTRSVLPAMIEKRQGHIVNVGSVAGHLNYPNGNIYCASKAAIRSLTECLRMDLLGQGIRVSSVSPGMVETEFSSVRLQDEKKARALYVNMHPLSAADVAEAIEWCLSRPAHVNIQDIVIYPTDQAAPGMVYRHDPRS